MIGIMLPLRFVRATGKDLIQTSIILSILVCDNCGGWNYVHVTNILR